MQKIAVIIGSLRRESINRRFANALAALARPAGLEFELVDRAEVPLYNEDLRRRRRRCCALKRAIEGAAAVLFVTPEYNRSIPAVVKNVVDWGTRPYGQNSWAGKAGAIVGTSPGAVGIAVAQAHFAQCARRLRRRAARPAEDYFVSKPGLISDAFELTDAKSREFLAGFLAKFAHHVERIVNGRSDG